MRHISRSRGFSGANQFNARNVRSPEEAINVCRLVYFALINGMIVFGALAIALPFMRQGQAPAGMNPGPTPNPVVVEWIGGLSLAVLAVAAIGGPVLLRLFGLNTARDASLSPRQRGTAFTRASILFGAVAEVGGMLGALAAFFGGTTYLLGTALAIGLLLVHFPRRSMFEPRGGNPYATLHESTATTGDSDSDRDARDQVPAFTPRSREATPNRP